jgi:hypothetical protein
VEGCYLTRDGMKWFWDAYTTDPAQRAEVYASPRLFRELAVGTDARRLWCSVRERRSGASCVFVAYGSEGQQRHHSQPGLSSWIGCPGMSRLSWGQGGVPGGEGLICGSRLERRGWLLLRWLHWRGAGRRRPQVRRTR